MVTINTKYPGDLVSIIHDKTGFSVDYKLTTSSGTCTYNETSLGKDGEPPYKPVPPLQDPAYSRLVFTLINGKKFAYGNFPAADIEKVYERSKQIQSNDAFIAKLKNAFTQWGIIDPSKIKTPDPEKNESANDEELLNSIAFTRKFHMGTGISGKSPAQVCIDDGNTQKVEKQKSFLESKLKDYPANQEMIDACNEAIRLFNEGKLNKTSGNSDSQDTGSDEKLETIYDSQYKPITTILPKHASGENFTKEELRGSKEERYYFTYRIIVEKDYSKRNPIKLSIENKYMAMKTASNGQSVPDSNKTAKVNNIECGNSFYMYMTEEEWIEAMTYIHLNYVSHVINTQTERVGNANRIRELASQSA